MSKTNKSVREAKRHLKIRPEDCDLLPLIPTSVPVQFEFGLGLKTCEPAVENLREQVVHKLSSHNPQLPQTVFTYERGRIIVKRVGFVRLRK